MLGSLPEELLRSVSLFVMIVSVGFVLMMVRHATTWPRRMRYISFVLLVVFAITEIVQRFGTSLTWRTPLALTAAMIGLTGIYFDRQP